MLLMHLSDSQIIPILGRLSERIYLPTCQLLSVISEHRDTSIGQDKRKSNCIVTYWDDFLVDQKHVQ